MCDEIIKEICILQEALHFIDYQQHIINEMNQASTVIINKYDQVVKQISELIMNLIKQKEKEHQNEYHEVPNKRFTSNTGIIEKMPTSNMSVNYVTDSQSQPKPTANQWNPFPYELNEPLNLTIPKADRVPALDAKIKPTSLRQISNDSGFVEITSMTPSTLVRPRVQYRQSNITRTIPPLISKSELTQYCASGKGEFTDSIQTFPVEVRSSTEDIGRKKDIVEGINGLSGERKSLTQDHKKIKIFACEKCSSTFHHKCNLTRHMRIHNNERPYVCNICNDSFVQRCHLTCHMRIHTGEKPFKCPYCDARFRHKSNVKCHVRIHTGEKPYKCNVCFKAFGQKGQLTCHMARHTGLRPHHCTLCDSKFSHKAHLTAHLRVHTGARPFACTVCSRAFSQKGNLKSHMKRHEITTIESKLIHPRNEL